MCGPSQYQHGPSGLGYLSDATGYTKDGCRDGLEATAHIRKTRLGDTTAEQMIHSSATVLLHSASAVVVLKMKVDELQKSMESDPFFALSAEKKVKLRKTSVYDVDTMQKLVPLESALIA